MRGPAKVSKKHPPPQLPPLTTPPPPQLPPLTMPRLPPPMQIQAPSPKTGSVHCQWLPKYPRKRDAALAYDIANAWRVTKKVAGVTEHNVSACLSL